MGKIDKIQNLKFQELQNCMLNLVKRLGYTEVELSNETIKAKLESPLSIELFEFVIFDEQLSGNIDVKGIAKTIVECQSKSLANAIYVVSKHNISKGFQESINNEISLIKLNFLGRDDLIKLIEKYFEDFWKHDDLALLEYEKIFTQSSSEDSQIKKLKIFDDKYQKLLSIFIEPRMYHSYEDKSTKTPLRKKINIDSIIEDTKNQIIYGDAGTGKTTLLNKIGENLIKNNTSSIIRNLPFFVSALEIFENSYEISSLVQKKINHYFPDLGKNVFTNYKVILLIDSIDEFEEEKQKLIIKELVDFSKKFNVKFILGTRNQERISSLFDSDICNKYQLEKFNNEQIRKFVASFFLDEKNKANELIDSLRENRIIERMPITPLTLSLISILYEENNLEIPATIADVYDNFNSLIIGRSTVTSRIQFIDISFKERILSLYALHIIEKQNRAPLTKTQFYDYFLEYYRGKTLPIKKGTLEDVLQYLIEHTGILVIKDDKWVKFSHDSYMEYYSALEIFKHQRHKEDDLVKNFFDHNWQNAGVFYAGKSKDLPIFLEKIIDRLKKASNLQDFFVGVLGVGYLLQALYQTDNILRKNALLEALELSVKAYEITTKLAADNSKLFKNYNLPILQLMNVMYFYENFNSLTVKEPLKLAFKDLFEEFKTTKNSIAGYKSMKLALTLDSKRIEESSELEELIEDKDIFKDPSLYAILDFSLGFLEKEKYKKLKDEIRKDHYRRISDPVRELIKLPASRLRFTNLDTLAIERKVQLVVEGKTDAEIIEHAYYCLTGGNFPYWSISSSGNISGGASEVAKTLQGAKPIAKTDSIIIGIFDHDSKGLQEFRGLKENVFKTQIVDTIRKHNDKNIFAICLPIPGEKDYYIKREQEFNFFSIEHYFDDSILEAQGLYEKTPMEGIFKIKDSKKKAFSKYIREQTEPKLFEHFVQLFSTIDKIAEVEIEYEG